jgi:HEAT repeat protein
MLSPSDQLMNSIPVQRIGSVVSLVLSLGLIEARALADAPSVIAAAGGGQPALGATLIGGVLFYKACPQVACTPTTADSSVQLPLGTPPNEVVIDVLSLGAARHALFAHTASWGALLAAAPSPTPEARVLWSGANGFSKGEAGERYGDLLQVTEPDADKSVRVLLGEAREDVTICGRPSILSPKVLDPKDLTFKGARVQRLRRDERDKAVPLNAVLGPEVPLKGLGSVLQAAAASSAIGSPGALTDGDPETTWSEKRGGDGNGEFVQFNAPEQVEITSLSIVARPPTKEVPKGAGPRKIWVATGDALFAVNFADDPWAKPGASYDVKFPAPLKTRCLAVVLDEAYVKAKEPDPDVTLAEITAHTEFDGKADPASLAGALAGGQARARMAAAILSRGGDAAYDAVSEAYPKLDDAGRVLALEVIDNAPCSKSAPMYVKAMEVGRAGEAHHADDRLVRCSHDAAPALAAALGTGSDKQKVHAANLLALVAPEVAISSLVPLLPAAKPEVRSEFRAALTRAAHSPSAKETVTAKLADASVPPVALIDLLRAATSRPGGAGDDAAKSLTKDASPAFARLATPDADFRTRYLLIAPAAQLAREGDARAEAFVVKAIASDPDIHVRAHAAELASELPSALDPLVHALDDADPRVRDAALVAVGKMVDPKGAKVQARPWPAALFGNAAKLLVSDPFTFVRGHSADVLLGAPPGDEADKPLAKSLADLSPVVRARAIEILGRRGARRYADDIRERLDDEEEILDVRVRAARALGRVCDKDSVDRLTELSRLTATPGASGAALVVGASAAAALGRLNPPDLQKRLAPLADPSAPRIAQEIAKSALTTTERCR